LYCSYYGAGILAPLEEKFDGGPAVIFLFLFAIACSFAAFFMLNLHPWFLCQEVLILIPMLPSGIDSLDYWLGLDNGICHGNITVAISWSDYFTSLGEYH
jgi:hypothetical protein